MPALWVRRQLVARSVFYQSSCSASSVTKPPLQKSLSVGSHLGQSLDIHIDPQFCPVVELLALTQRQEGVCSFLQPSYDEERVQCRDFPLSGIESSHIDSSGIESLRIDSSLIDPPIRRFPLNLVGFYVWRRITCATHDSSDQVKRLIIF